MKTAHARQLSVALLACVAACSDRDRAPLVPVADDTPSLARSGADGSTAQAGTPRGKKIPDQYIVVLRDGASADETAKRNDVAAQRGSGVRVYIVGSGIRTSHGEFDGPYGTNRAVHGYEFVDGDAVAEDCNGLGTHLAGLAGGATYGVAKGATLVSVRVFSCSGSGAYRRSEPVRTRAQTAGSTAGARLTVRRAPAVASPTVLRSRSDSYRSTDSVTASSNRITSSAP